MNHNFPSDVQPKLFSCMIHIYTFIYLLFSNMCISKPKLSLELLNFLANQRKSLKSLMLNINPNIIERA